MKKRMLALLLTLCMVLSLLPAQVVVAEVGVGSWSITGLSSNASVGDTATATVE